jgi:hypothetical protein
MSTHSLTTNESTLRVLDALHANLGLAPSIQIVLPQNRDWPPVQSSTPEKISKSHHRLTPTIAAPKAVILSQKAD